MNATPWRIFLIVVALPGSGWMVYAHLEARQRNVLLSEQLRRYEVLLDTALLVSAGTRQSLVNHADVEMIVSWNPDACPTLEQIEHAESIRARLRQDERDCEEAWSSIRMTRSNMTQTPSEAALADAARKWAQRCLVSTRATQEVITKRIAQAKSCDTVGSARADETLTQMPSKPPP